MTSGASRGSRPKEAALACRVACSLLGVALVVSAWGASAQAAAGKSRRVVAAASYPSARSPSGPPKPFGLLDCVPQYGIRLCKGGLTATADLRVRSFDGVPLDADVALPATGRGPFPLIVLLHGLGESKTEWETDRDDGAVDDVTLADRGYAVLMYTARGFGESCGTPASRVNTPACARGWIQLADQRYEIRDTEYLAGKLVDEGLAKPDFAVAGVSYGAGQALELAMLKNRIRLPDGRFVPLTSPVRHIPMEVAAVYAMWPWDDLVSSLVPNGWLSTTTNTSAATDRSPVGVPKLGWVSPLYGVTAGGYLAPPGADPESDLTVWYHELLRGEPTRGSETQALRVLQEYKSAIGIPMPKGGPAPTAIQSGWTDSLFPVSEAMHYAERVKTSGSHTPMLLMFADIGHGWAQDKPADVAVTNRNGLGFLDSVMLSHTRPKTGVVAIATTCPSVLPSGAPITGSSLASLAKRSVSFSGTRTQQVTASGGDPATASALNPVYASPLCHFLPGKKEPGTATYTRSVGLSALSMVGAPRITANITVKGNYPELVGRLWDLSAGGLTRQIVSLGAFRPSVNQRSGTSSSAVAHERVTFELPANDYTFAAGHSIELELVGNNPPLFRPSNGHFTISVSDLRVTVPAR